MRWLGHHVTMPAWALLCILVAAGLAVVSLGWQTWQCSRWHFGVPDAQPAKWDGQAPATAAGRSGETEKAAS